MGSVEKRRMCPNCRAFVTTDDRVCPYCDMQLGPRAKDLRATGAALGGLIPQAYLTTVMILGINFALYLVDALSSGDMIKAAGASLPWPMHGQYYRLVTAGFLHGNVFHILMNSWVLFSLGTEVEQLYDTSRLIVFYFVSTVTGFLASSLFGHVSLGSSAGIFGLIGAMLAFGFLDKSNLALAVRAHYGQWAVFALVMSFFPGTDYMAHFGGLAGGALMGAILSTPRARLMWKEPAIRGAAGVCLAITALCFGQMILNLMARPA